MLHRWPHHLQAALMHFSIAESLAHLGSVFQVELQDDLFLRKFHYRLSADNVPVSGWLPAPLSRTLGPSLWGTSYCLCTRPGSVKA